MTKGTLKLTEKIALCFLGAILAYFPFHMYLEKTVEDARRKSDEESIRREERFREKINLLMKEDAVKPRDVTVSKPSDSTDWVYTEQQSKEVQEWMERTGSFTQDAFVAYESYSDATLESLGKQGDIKALQILGDRFFHARNYIKAREYYEMAVVRGSIMAIRYLTLFPKYPQTEDSLLETLALCEVVKMRGDTYNGEMEFRSLLNSYKRLNDKDFILSDSQSALIKDKASEMYNAWSARRKELGLGEFDNTIPSGLQGLYEELERQK